MKAKLPMVVMENSKYVRATVKMTVLIVMLRIWKGRLDELQNGERTKVQCLCQFLLPQKGLSLRLKTRLGDRTDLRRGHRAPTRAERYKDFVP
jgi:hypothetical protein